MNATCESISLEPIGFYKLKSLSPINDSCETSAMDHIKVLISTEKSNIYSIVDESNGDSSVYAHSIEKCMDDLALANSFGDDSTMVGQCSGQNTREEGPNKSILSHQLIQGEQRSLEEIYRLRMSDWCYKICDYIKAERYNVHVAFNYLDRFLAEEKYSCDSSLEYKVASVTCLLIALKVYNRKTIKPSILADLSSGEITTNDILTMECMILKTLAYKLCPPTSYSYINSFYPFLPSRVKDTSGQRFIEHATFLSELSIMDMSFRSVARSLVAFAAILHALDSMGPNFISLPEKEMFIKKIAYSLNIACNWNTSSEGSRIRNMFTRLFHRCDYFKALSNSVQGGCEDRDIANHLEIDKRDDVPETSQITFCHRSLS